MSDLTQVLSDFALDVKKGLTTTPKTLLSKYFYDDRGSKLFQDIMQVDEYYPTRKEYEILEMHKADFMRDFQSGDQPFNLIEMGSGDGLKTKILLRYFVAQNVAFQYSPIDISKSAMDQLTEELEAELPALQVTPQIGDYFTALDELHQHSAQRKVILCMGGNIGNFSIEGARNFLCNINQYMDAGDLIVIGVDLRKDPRTILAAYDDSQGITEAFNLNLLHRINKELGGHFEIDNFLHYPFYHIETGEVRSYLVSKIQQEVPIDLLNITVPFQSWEYIHTEISKKYSIPELEKLASDTGFQVMDHLFDKEKYFVNSVWKK